MSRPQIPLQPLTEDQGEHSSLGWVMTIMPLALPAALAVVLAIVSALAWSPLVSHSSRMWGDLLFVLSQNAAMAVSTAYAVASIVALLTRHRLTYPIVVLFLLTSSLFVAMSSSLWLKMMGSREFRATKMESWEEFDASSRAILPSAFRTPPALALVPHSITLDLGIPPEPFEVRILSRQAGGPSKISPPLPSSTKLALGAKIKLSLQIRTPSQTLDPYPPRWVTQELSGYGWAHSLLPPRSSTRSQRPRR